jgi:hypothetical protein
VIGISPVPAKTLSTCWFKQPDMGIYRWFYVGESDVGKTRCASGKPSMNVILGMPRFDILIGGLNVT